jgi:tRNA A-37 threonylcarbamoyl transferase component Bud32
MSFLLERVQKALRPHYEVERELASGGMGIVFVAHDPTLDRRVAIKVLRPEMATAVAAERFLREARLLATLSHPNIVAIHQAGEAGGLHYYVMDLIEGESLAARLERGPLSVPGVASLGVQLLSALEAVHQLGTVHRDVKPANIFLMKDRALLGDFGIARTSSDTTLTKPDQWVGTPAYAAPEQSTGDVSARTDLYSVGMVLYEACSGRRWNREVRVADADWTGVPLRVAASLKRALARSPDNRWADATEFRKALERIQHRSVLRPAGVLALIAAAALLLLIPPAPLCNVFQWWPRCGGPPDVALPDLAISPLDVAGGADPSLGRDFADVVRHGLHALPDIVFAEPESTSARFNTEGQLIEEGEQYIVRMFIIDSTGTRTQIPDYRSGRDSWVALTDSIGHYLVCQLFPQFCNTYVGPKGLAPVPLQALSEFLAGERAFERDAWTSAANHFDRALGIDSTFALAAWRRADTRRWRRIPTDTDLGAIYARYKERFRPLDTLLISAQLEPNIAERLERYALAASSYPNDAYAKLLYGSEVFHRGALSGVSLEHALNILEEARRLNPRSGPVLNQVIWAHIRLGNQPEAHAALEHRVAIPTPPEEDIDVKAVLGLAYDLRFSQSTAENSSSERLGNLPSDVLYRIVRWGLSFDIPRAQFAIGSTLAAAPDATPLQLAGAHTAQGVALVALGRPNEALSHLDSARVFSPTDTARLQINEWRVLLPLLGVESLPEDAVGQGRQVLEALAPDEQLGARAAWALALDAYANRDAIAMNRWYDLVRRHAASVPSAAPLATLLEAMHHALRHEYEAALATSRSLVGLDTTGGGGDPFSRSILHRHRALWFEEIGQLQEAEKEWLWYENADFPGWLEGEVHAAEIDWAVGTYARLARSRVLHALGDEERACQMVSRLLEIWTDPEPQLTHLRDRAAEHARECPT